MTVAGIQLSKALEPLGADCSDSIGGPIEGVVVKADHDVVRRDMEVGLQEPVAEPHGPSEGLHRVFGPQVAAAPMGDGHRRSPLFGEHPAKVMDPARGGAHETPGWCGQRDTRSLRPFEAAKCA